MLEVSFTPSSLPTAGASGTIAITLIAIDLSVWPNEDKLTDADWIKLDLAVSSFPSVDTVIVGFSDRTRMLSFTTDVSATKMPLSSARFLFRCAVGYRRTGWQRVTSGWDVDKTHRTPSSSWHSDSYSPCYRSL